MSRHEGVSCDSCLKGNFRGKRYKCLICYDYDLCATCYEAGATTTRHTTDHPMQCILTRSDFDLYYGGEAVSIEHPQSFTCPFCGRMGLTESTLQEHVTAEHSDSSVEIVCPVCAAQPGGEPNHMIDDFSAHLALDHRNPRDLDEPSGSRHVRRIPHPGRGMNSARTRRSQMQFSSSSGLASLSPSSRDSMDPIAELLSQLSSVRRSNLAQSNTTSQLQQLQMQLQMERQQAQVARQQLERLPRRQAATSIATSSATSATGANNTSQQSQYTVVLEPSPSPSSSSSGPQFLLSRCTEPVITEGDQQALEIEHADRSLFVQELLLNTLADQFICDEWDSLTKLVGLTSDSEESPTQRHSTSSFNSDDIANHLASFVGQISAITQEQENNSAQQQSSQNQEADDQQTWNVNSSTCRSSGSVASGRQSSRNANNTSHGSSVPAAGRGVNMQRTASREGLSRQIGRTTSREGGTSPSSNRRKTLRQVDDRNKTTEPPPPH